MVPLLCYAIFFKYAFQKAPPSGGWGANLIQHRVIKS
jgi:hypothetical protein